MFLLLLLVWETLAANNQTDSIKISKNWYRLHPSKLSENGKWIVINKLYETNADTVYLYRVNLKDKKVLTNIKEIAFLNDFAFITKRNSNNQIQIVNLEKKEQTTTFNAVNYFKLIELHAYGYLQKDTDSLIINQYQQGKWNPLLIIDYVSNYYINQNNSYLLIVDKQNKLSITNLQNLKSHKFEKFNYSIDKVVWNKQQDNILLYTTCKKLYVLDIKKEKLSFITSFDHIKNLIQPFFEFTTNNQIIISYNTAIPLIDHDTLDYIDIWRGNDKELEKKSWNNPNFKYNKYLFTYNLDTQTTTPLVIPKKTIEIAINNQNHIIYLDVLKHQDYQTYFPKVDLYLKDTRTNKDTLIGDSITDINHNFTYSATGQNIAIKKKGKWMIYQVDNKETFSLNKLENQEKLFWTDDPNLCLLIAQNNLWRINIAQKSFKRLTNFSNPFLKCEILNIHSYKTELKNQFVQSSSYIYSKAPILLQTIDSNSHTNSLYKIDATNNTKIIVDNANNRTYDIVWSKDYSIIAYKKEDFNFPTSIEIHTPHRKYNLKNDLPIQYYNWRKQVIIQYKDNFGHSLQGILFYPKQYQETGKYPMIVHIYENQHHLKNYFDIPTFTSYMGLSIPLLNELGYFVFLPDTQWSSIGPGLSALQCVEIAVDKITQIESTIDKKKLGLIGQSFGGYQTNFIISQTNLFAAAISGAAVNDFVWDYYSYNYNFNKPNYWRYKKDGQSKIIGSFTENKKQFLENSPITNAGTIKTPLLSWTGMKDYNVHWEHTKHFYMALKEHKVPHIALFYKDQAHSMNTLQTQKDLTLRVIDWFDFFLKNRSNISWIKDGITYD